MTARTDAPRVRISASIRPTLRSWIGTYAQRTRRTESSAVEVLLEVAMNLDPDVVRMRGGDVLVTASIPPSMYARLVERADSANRSPSRMLTRILGDELGWGAKQAPPTTTTEIREASTR